MGGGSRGGHLHSRARGTGELGDGSSAAGARAIPSLAWLHARVHYAGQHGQCAVCGPCNAAACSGVLLRLPTIDGSLEASLEDALDDAEHAVGLHRARLHLPAEQKQTGHGELVPLPLPCHGLQAELLVLGMVSTTETYDPTTLLSWSMLVVPLQQPLCLLHFCATCGHCKRDGQTGRAPGTCRGMVSLDGMRGAGGRGAACRPARGPAATLSPFC